MRAWLIIAVLLCLGTTASAESLPWPFDMKVEQAAGTADGIKIVTTGGVFEFRPASGEVLLQQRIGNQRDVAILRLDPGLLMGLRVTEHDGEAVKLRSQPGLDATVTCDSVLRLDSGRAALAVTVTGSFEPEFLRVERQGVLALDNVGGIGVYPLPQVERRPTVQKSENGFSFKEEMPSGGTLLVGVCPPREYNWKQHAEERIVHQFPQLAPGVWMSDGASPRALPTDEELAAWRKYANVLVLHLEFWDGFGVRHIKPKDPARFKQVVDLAHKLGYLVLPYSSPYYYQPAMEPGGKLRSDATALYLAEAKWLLDEYNVDGLYWDGQFNDILQAWECIRQTRKLLGSKRLYVHCTTMPLPYWELYCPFVDTWADYLLRGEGLAWPTVDQIYMRYTVSGYNVSNAIGELCYDTCRVDRTAADWALWSNARIPYWPGRQVHGGRKYFLTDDEEKVFRDHYIPAADRVKGAADYAPLAALGRQDWLARKTQVEMEIQAGRKALADYIKTRREQLGPTAADNLAAFKTGVCSDWTQRHTGQHGIGHPLEYATDQNLETYWGADFLPQWIAIDLGRSETISRVRVQTYFGDKRYYHYRVEVSGDNRTWRPVAAKMDNAPSTEKGDEHRFEPCEARYLRVTILANSANDAGHIVELSAFR